MHCVGGQRVASAFSVAVLTTLFLLKLFSLLVVFSSGSIYRNSSIYKYSNQVHNSTSRYNTQIIKRLRLKWPYSIDKMRSKIMDRHHNQLLYVSTVLVDETKQCRKHSSLKGNPARVVGEKQGTSKNLLPPKVAKLEAKPEYPEYTLNL